MISDTNTAVTTGDDTIKALLVEETNRAKDAEKANSDEIARIDAALALLVESDDGVALNSIKELATWINEHGAGAEKMSEAITANEAAIKKINDDLPGAIAAAMVKADGTSIINTDGTFSVGAVSTDLLVQGKQTLILNGGSADIAEIEE